MIRTLEQKQLDLEVEMGSMGVLKYFKKLESQGQDTLKPGLALIEHSLTPLVEQLDEFYTATRTGQARRFASTSHYLKMIGHKEVAYITLKRIINGLSSRDRLVAMAESIATLLEDELNYRVFHNEAPHLMKRIINNLKGTAANDQHKRKVIQGAQTKLANIDKVLLPPELRIKIGTKLIELVVNLKLIHITSHNEGKNKTVLYVEPTDSLQVWLALQNNQCSLLSPVFLPMVSKPKAWTTPFDGGYLSTPLTMLKVRNRTYLEELRHVEMPMVYTSLNSMQETPWVINKGIYEVIRTLWETTGGGIAGMPFKDGKDIPEKPIDIDTNERALKAWKGRAASTHNENFKSRAKVIALSQKLWVAAKYLNEEAIYFPHVMDWRGRAYAVPGFVNPQSDDIGKALIHFADGKPLGETGAAWLAIHLANTYGYDKVDFDKRIEWAQLNTESIMDSALRPIDGERFWLNADKPFQFLAACFEWIGYCMQGSNYVSHIAVALDGSCNGLQNFSAMLRDERGGRATNLVPSEKPSDIYQEVANVVQGLIDIDAEANVKEALVWNSALYKTEGKWGHKPIGRKLTKRNTMTRPYSVTAFGMRDQLVSELDDMLKDDTIKLNCEKAEVSGVAYYLADKNLKAISTVVVAAEEAMRWLQEVAKVVSSNNLSVVWHTPIGLPVRQFYTNQIADKLEVHVAGKRMTVQFNISGTTLNARKQSAGISPNFVHGCDASHMMRTISMCKDVGINSFSMIHDSYGVHCCDTERLGNILRQAFVAQYSEDVLGNFRDEIVEQLVNSGAKDLVKHIPELPAYGTLDLSVVLDSEYFFA